MDKLRVNNLDIWYRVDGSGPWLVLIMGLTASMDWWDPGFTDALARNYRLLMFDNRGAGRTTSPDEDFSISQMAGDTAALMQKLEISRASVLGFSMGGMIAQELALEYPLAVERLVLCATFPGGRESILADREVLLKLVDRSGSGPEVVKRFASLLFPPGWLEENPGYLKDFTRRYLAAPASNRNATRQFMATTRFKAGDRLGGINIPTMVACGDSDVIIPGENSRILAKRIPGARLVEYPGAGHGFITQCREEFLRDLRGFLD